MAPLKLFYLTSELTPFSQTNNLAIFSRKISTILHNKDDIDIRLTKPKYGFISERKYILREVIRLKDMPIIFNGKERLVNLKSAFIPESRVQVYFIEDEKYFKKLPELLYKARNGRVYSDNDERFALFGKIALDTLKKLYWPPDYIICNDWQMFIVPRLLKENYYNDDFYKNIKVVSLIHSINDYRFYSKDSFKKVDLDEKSTNGKIDCLEQAIKYSDLNILINDQSLDVMNDYKSNKKIKKQFEQTNHSIVDINGSPTISDWLRISNEIESMIRKIK